MNNKLESNHAPNPEAMLAHLDRLFSWTETSYRNARFEMRFIDDSGRCENFQYDATDEGIIHAVATAVHHNELGFNCYVGVNPLRAGHTGCATTDEDITVSKFQYIDLDSADDAKNFVRDRVIGAQPSFIVRTGSVPIERLHCYWELAEPTTNMPAWEENQARLIERFSSDPRVRNPSRVLRLAGSVSYPPARKRAKGYVDEVTSLVVIGSVVPNAFVNAYARPIEASVETDRTEALNPTVTAPERPCGVPLAVVEAAFSVIPPSDDRDRWLRLGMAAKHGNENSFPVWDAWSRQSPIYDSSDQLKTWSSLSPNEITVATLFEAASAADPKWWRASSEVEQWWSNRAQELAPAKPTIQGLPILNIQSLMELAPPNWLIPGLIIEKQLAMLVAPPASYKSFVALNVAFRLAHGMDWQGTWLEPRGVIYIAAEGVAGMHLRVEALFKHYGMKPRNSPLYTVSSTVDLTNTPAVDRAVDDLKAVLGHQDIGLVIVDTLSRCIAGKNENAAEVMTQAVENAARIGRAFEAATLLVHHVGKDASKGARGHSSLFGAVDSCLEFERLSDGGLLTVRKHKDSDDNVTVPFQVHRVELGIMNGEMRSSLVVEPGGEIVAKPVRKDELDLTRIAAKVEIGETVPLSDVVARLGRRKGRATGVVRDLIPLEWTDVPGGRLRRIETGQGWIVEKQAA